MKLYKLQCAGNKFVLIDCFRESVDNQSDLAKEIFMADAGIDAYGVIFLTRSECADFCVRVFTPGGYEEEISGTALFCSAKYIIDKNLSDKVFVKVETLSGIVSYEYVENNIVLNLGEPKFTPQCVPVDYTGDEFINKYISVCGEEYAVTCVSVGNPNAVTYVETLDNIDIDFIGPRFETHQIFPIGSNIEFVKIIDNKTLEMRIWKRGREEVAASCTGACAAVVSSVISGLTDRKVIVKNECDDFSIEWNADDECVYISSSAEMLHEDEWK